MMTEAIHIESSDRVHNYGTSTVFCMYVCQHVFFYKSLKLLRVKLLSVQKYFYGYSK